MNNNIEFIGFLIILFLTGSCDNKTPLKTISNGDISTIRFYENDSTVNIKNGLLINGHIISEIERHTSWQEQEGFLFIDTLINLNDSSFYVLYEISSGVCKTDYLMTFSQNKTKDFVQLEQNCDTEQSNPCYEYSELRSAKNDVFEKVIYKLTPIDKNTLDKDGNFKDGYSQDNVEMQTDSTIIRFSISDMIKILRDTLKM